MSTLSIATEGYIPLSPLAVATSGYLDSDIPEEETKAGGIGFSLFVSKCKKPNQIEMSVTLHTILLLIN